MLFRSKKHDVVIEMGPERVRLLKLIFRPDASLLVTFPGLSNLPGLVGRVETNLRKGYPENFDMGQLGKLTSHVVKCSFHPDGRVHFSQDGKIKTEVRNQCKAWSDVSGHLFTVHFSGLKYWDRSARSRGTQPSFVAPHDISEGKLICHKYPATKLHPPIQQWNPMKGAEILMEGKRCQFPIILAPPESDANDTVLLLATSSTSIEPGAAGARFVFLGGFAGGLLPHQEHLPVSFLCAMYPCSNANELQHVIGTIDLAAQFSGS